MEKMLQITLTKSLIGRLPKHVYIAKQLGLTKIRSTVKHKNTPSILGLVNSIQYMVTVEEI